MSISVYLFYLFRKIDDQLIKTSKTFDFFSKLSCQEVSERLLANTDEDPECHETRNGSNLSPAQLYGRVL